MQGSDLEQQAFFRKRLAFFLEGLACVILTRTLMLR
jgi:hypothetical protein